MTIRNDVRRKVVQELRDLVGVYMDDPDGIFNQELLYALGVGIGSTEDFADPADVYRLARLIDRPTCRNAADSYEGNIFECSNCGETWELTCGTPADNHLCFCPRCGAEVVE